MAYFIVTGPMGLPIPTLDDPGPDYAINVNNALTIISSHTHDGSPNGGSVIDLSQQACSDDLSLNENNLTNVKSLRMLTQPSALVGAQDINCLYVNNQVLGFNNSNGIFVPIVEGNSVVIDGAFTNFSARAISASTTILPTDTYNLVNVTTTSSAVTINLPIAAAIVPVPAMRLYIIRDITQNAEDNNITLHCATGNTWADSGLANFVISNDGGYVGIYTDGVSKWYTFTQNMYSEQFLKLDSSVFDQINGLENKVGMTSNFTTGTINITSSVEISNLGATLFRGQAVTFQDHGGGAHSLLELQNGSTAIFRSGTTVTQSAGSQLNLNGTSILNGSIVIPTGGAIFVNTDGVINLNASGNLLAGAAASIELLALGSCLSEVTAAFKSTVPAGLVTTAAPSGALTSGLALGGGSSDFPCFTNSSGVSAPRTRSIWQPLSAFVLVSGWPAAQANNWFGTNSANMLTLMLPVMHNGATLNSVDILINITNTHANLTGITFPRIFLWRQSTAINQADWGSSEQFLSSTDPQFYPTPANVAAYENSGLTQIFSYTCNQNNVIDTTNFLYFLGIRDEIGGSSQNGNFYNAVRLNYSNIVDMRFPT